MSVFTYREELPYRLFVVGDIHACPSELNSLLEYMKGKLSLGSNDLVVFIGDYIDRGPDSKAVLETLVDFRKEFPSAVFLKGNHEDMLLGYLGLGGTLGANYMYNGGVQFLMSYKLSSVDPPSEIIGKLPAEHLEFVKTLERGLVVGDFILVHAGLNPLAELEQQEERDLFWIRDEFIMNIHRFEKTVVFGHTPYEEIMVSPPYKIGIDTGLVYGNKLSCVELLRREYFQVARGSKRVTRGSFMDKMPL